MGKNYRNMKKKTEMSKAVFKKQKSFGEIMKLNSLIRYSFAQ